MQGVMENTLMPYQAQNARYLKTAVKGGDTVSADLNPIVQFDAWFSPGALAELQTHVRFEKMYNTT